MGARKDANIKSETLTEQAIQGQLNHVFAAWKYNVDGLFVFNWESDKLIWTKSGYIYEFEIKVSRADFRNDFKHKKDKHVILSSGMTGEKYLPLFWEYFEKNKHLFPTLEIWEAHCRKFNKEYFVDNYRKPNYFYYAVPEGLIQPEEVPEYAGLIYILKECRYERSAYVMVKRAPCLHKQKYKDEELMLAEKFWYNWQSDRQRREQMQRERDEARKALKDELANRNQEEPYETLKWKYDMACSERDKYHKLSSILYRDQKVDKMMIRRMYSIIKDFEPDFSLGALEEECERDLGIK